MNHILNLAILGAFAGMIASFWTRIIKKNMIFNFVHIFLTRIDQKHIIDTGFGSDAPLSTFLRCVFCLAPWICFALDVFYIIEFHPWWLYAVIGIIAGLGMGNFVAELIHALRNGD